MIKMKKSLRKKEKRKKKTLEKTKIMLPCVLSSNKQPKPICLLLLKGKVSTQQARKKAQEKIQKQKIL